MTALDDLTAIQVDWAHSRGVPVDGHVAESIDANLFMPLRRDTLTDFEQSGGDELGRGGRRPGLSSLISSAALACNVFDPWRNGHVGSLASVVSAGSSADRLRFEPPCPTGVPRSVAYPDVLLDGSAAKPTAIEVKFLEPYRGQENAFKPPYFNMPHLWDRLPGLREVAAAINAGEPLFTHLGAAQLVKHALGMSNRWGDRDWRLVYLWYEYPSAEQRAHAQELESFTAMVDGQFDFVAVTWQEVFARLELVEEPVAGHVEYLRARYFDR